MKNIFLALFFFVATVTFAQTNFSDATIKNFAKAYSEIREQNNLMQLNMVSEIEKAGLTNDEFTTIHMNLKDPSKSSDVTKDEVNKYNAALENIKTAEKDGQKSFQTIIENNGLKLETYQAIAKKCNEDEAFNTKVMAFIYN